MGTLTFLAVLLSAFLHASWNVAGKKVAHIMAVPMFGFLFSGLFLTPFLITNPIDWTHWKMILFLVALSSIIHAIYIVSLFKAYEQWDVSIVYPVVRSTGIMICAITSIWFFKEQLSPIGLIGISLILAGIIFKGIVKTMQTHNPIDPKTIPSAVFVGTCVGAYLIVDRLAINLVNPIQFISLLNVGIGILLLPYFYITKPGMMTIALKHHKKYIVMIGFAAMGSYLIILWVFKQSSFGYITSLRESSIVFATAYGYWLLKERITKVQLLSIVVMMIGAVLIKLG